MVDAVILAGGKGSRMEDALPKALVEARGKPIVSWQIDYLSKFEEVDKIILSLGYESGKVVDYVGQNYVSHNLDFAIEDEPLGTAGGMKKALSKSVADFVVALNCDDITDIFIPKLVWSTENVLCVANPRLPYGRVVVEKGMVKKFEEKPLLDNVWVSCGWYYFDRHRVLDVLPNKGSLEYDVFPNIGLKAFEHRGFWRALNSKKDLADFEKVDLPNSLL
ncbi:MAG: NTP transferase domain-containing protein [archaeon]